MRISRITEPMVWEIFLLSQPFTLFTQSWNYGKFYESLGEKFWVYGVYDEDKLVAGAMVVSTHARRGNYLYIPYGPIISPDNVNRSGGILLLLTDFLRNFSKKNGYAFIRVSPFMDENEKNLELFKDSGYHPAPIHSLAETTWLLDLTPDEETLLQQMNKNHRNLIRRCLKEGVRIEMTHDQRALEDFNQLHDTTASRHNFHRFSADYITKEFNALGPEKVVVFRSYLQNNILDSAAIVIYYGKMAAYRHGASLNGNNKIPTSYLLQWLAIQEAKRRGLCWYNFWGIAPKNASSNHPFRGISHFKCGFGGFPKQLVAAEDCVVSSKYAITWVIETARRWRRGF